MRGIRKKFCGDAVGDALRAIGRRRGDRDPVPDDFTERERFDMFRHLMHEHVYPCADYIGHEGRFTYSWTHSIWSWRHGGKRKFIERVKASAQEELAAADYDVYDLREIRCLIGDDGSRFCRMLVAADAAMMEQKMNGMVADLATIDRKLKWFCGGGHAGRVALMGGGFVETALPVRHGVTRSDAGDGFVETALSEIRYRIALYDHSYEAVIRGGKGVMLWTMLMP